jgi:ribokinase
MGAGVFVVGALHLDVVVDAPHLPQLDETVVGQGVAYRFGGKGGNQAVAAARFGADVAMAGRVGRGGFGDAILRTLDEEGVDRRQVAISEGASGMSVAIVNAEGSYGAVIVSGVNRDIRGEEIEIPKGTRVLLLQNEIPAAVNLAVAERARGKTRVVLNAAPVRPVEAHLLGQVDVLVVNRVEAAGMTGIDPASGDAAAAVAALQAMGPSSVLVTLGAGGLVGATQKGGLFRKPAHDVGVVSTHGAGDTFVGALAAELVQGRPLDAATDFAQAAAALFVSTAVGARPQITRDAVLTFQAERP